ncbi:hypothetical protein HGRIS_001122 [Hohenbuehelia grisea]|uniref:Uncharacterized protein n=1 Tax=Hohenbuehelia grisea TaxID=104357 RepID=A0ABR3JPL1_9AGAR
MRSCQLPQDRGFAIFSICSDMRIHERRAPNGYLFHVQGPQDKADSKDPERLDRRFTQRHLRCRCFWRFVRYSHPICSSISIPLPAPHCTLRMRSLDSHILSLPSVLCTHPSSQSLLHFRDLFFSEEHSNLRPFIDFVTRSQITNAPPRTRSPDPLELGLNVQHPNMMKRAQRHSTLCTGHDAFVADRLHTRIIRVCQYPRLLHTMINAASSTCTLEDFADPLRGLEQIRESHHLGVVGAHLRSERLHGQRECIYDDVDVGAGGLHHDL